jgi:hypothetical protein
VAILDTFYLLFKTNADEARKGMEGAEAGTKAFDAQLGRTDAHVAAVGAHIVGVFENVAIRIASAFAIEKIAEFTFRTLEVNGALQDTSERIGVAVEDLSALGNAAKYFGGTAEGATQSLDFLNKGMADIAVKGTSRLKPFFDELKINPLTATKHVKPLIEVYKELAGAFEKMTAQERAGYGEKFGIDQGLLLALASGRRGFEDIIARQKELGVVTNEDAEAADKFDKQLTDLGTIFHHVSTIVTTAILPAFGAMVDGITTFVEFVQAHHGLIEGFFLGAGGVIATFYTPAIIRATVATLAFLAEWLAIPILIAAVGAAFAFLYDDIKAFLTGNKSVIGELAKKWPIVGEAVHLMATNVIAAWDWLTGGVRGGVNLIGSVLNVLAAVFARVASVVTGAFHGITLRLAEAFPFWTMVFKGIGELLEWVVGLIIKAATWFGKLGFNAIAALPKAMQNWANDLNKVAVNVNGPKLALAANPAGTVAAVRAGQEHIAMANAAPVNAHTTNSMADHSRKVTKTTHVRIDKVEVHTQATDAKGVAVAVGDHLTEQLRQAVNHHDDGVDR